MTNKNRGNVWFASNRMKRLERSDSPILSPVRLPFRHTGYPDFIGDFALPGSTS
jgi:hypothetical protein